MSIATAIALVFAAAFVFFLLGCFFAYRPHRIYCKECPLRIMHEEFKQTEGLQ